MPDDGRRHELVDGELLVSPAPGLRHQTVCLRLSRLVDDACPADLYVVTAPFAVRTDVCNDIIKMAIQDPELRTVWPQLSPGTEETKKGYYCNLILNLQKVAHETGTIGLDELRGALDYLMSSPDMYSFWNKARRPGWQ